MGFQDQLSLNVGQKYCRMLQGEHSALLSTCSELAHGFKTFILSTLELPLKTGFTVIFKKIFQEHLTECQMVWIQIRTDVSGFLILVSRHMGLDAREPVFAGLRTKAQTSAADQRLCYSLIGKYDIKTCFKRNFTILYI